MTLREALEKHTRFVMFCGTCDCGEAKYDLDMKIFAFERGMEFTQEIELCKGKIVKDVAEEHKDYFWTVPFAGLGG